MNVATEQERPQLSPLIRTVEKSLADAHEATGLDTSTGFYNIPGMSGKKYRFFINALLNRLEDASYLEVGAWAGSTLCSAIHGNKVRATVVDNWRGRWAEVRDSFFANLARFRPPYAAVRVIEQDFRAVDFTAIGKFKVYLFDGPHEEIDQYDGIRLALPALTDEFVLIVDDWNWFLPRQGTFAAIRDFDLQVQYVQEIRTTMDGTHPEDDCGPDSDWHNGVCVWVLRKPS